MRAYVINTMLVLIIFPVILQTVINVIMLSIGGHCTTHTLSGPITGLMHS